MGRLMNNYYYGKAGKGDFKKSDLPENRWQLFLQMLRVRISALFRMNLMTVAAFLPLIIVIVYFSINLIYNLSSYNAVFIYGDPAYTDNIPDDFGGEENRTAYQEEFARFSSDQHYLRDNMIAPLLQTMALWMIPCILITGPIQAGMAYVNRNWARDEHAFIWSDFKDAVKDNWKQGLGISAITSVVPIIAVECWYYYTVMSEQNAGTMGLLFTVARMLVFVIAALWFLALVFAYPLMAGYRLTFRQLVKNSFTLAIARLPFTVGIRLAMLIPTLIAAMLLWFTSVSFIIVILVLAGYYVLLGNALARFVYASFTNAIFEKYINPRIPGAPTRSGLAPEEDEEDEDEVPADPAETEKKEV